MTQTPQPLVQTPPQPLTSELAAIDQTVRSLAQQSSQELDTTLALLRLLETLHRDISATYFQPLLPNNRQALYALLREIEGQGGWPYIPRMTLRSLLSAMEQTPDPSPDPSPNPSPDPSPNLSPNP
ncbi:hypothetical protein [Prochlorothrix hollandica]|uniref:Uncharacterized protein n=1 Tax=Prochlorothrix hollandica PCC 9006 = CALU 1027 TaxID=317619 RepID=A0A0M2PQU2_PROHO|nr:hypothetical protein [Prochlorothrix hollandica]KKI98589.1 hypothetical protein PROH_17000 [Prochlorothrix hollandica PCC 9006 = CALU 1027]